MNQERTKLELKSEDNIEINRIQEITRLHNEVNTLFTSGLEKAIRIGFLLEEQKKSMAHGKFTSWIDHNLPFKERTARNYMRLYRNRDEIKRQGIASLNVAYQALTEPKEKTLKKAIECLYGRLSEIEFMINRQSQIQTLKEIVNEATELEQQVAGSRIRLERKLVKLLQN